MPRPLPRPASSTFSKVSENGQQMKSEDCFITPRPISSSKMLRNSFKYALHCKGEKCKGLNRINLGKIISFKILILCTSDAHFFKCKTYIIIFIIEMTITLSFSSHHPYYHPRGHGHYPSRNIFDQMLRSGQTVRLNHYKFFCKIRGTKDSYITK